MKTKEKIKEYIKRLQKERSSPDLKKDGIFDVVLDAKIRTLNWVLKD